MTPDYAWAHREGRIARYGNKRVGGTICVHFIKKNMWFLETALAFLEMQDTTELEMRPSEPDEEESGPVPSSSVDTDSRKSRSRPGSSPGHREEPVDSEPDLANPDIKNGHDVPIMSNKGMLLHIDAEGGGGGAVVLSADEFEWSEGILGDDNKREVDLDTRGEPSSEGTVILPTAGHFANGSRRVNKR